MASVLSTTLAGIPLRNPVILSAGTCGVLDEFRTVLDLARIGAITTKSITREPREGNPVWRILPAGPAGMLNAIGLANPGLEGFLEHSAPRAATLPCPVIASVAGFSIDDYVSCAAHLDEFAERNIPAVELNVSCPNVRTGVEFGSTPALVRELILAVRPVLSRAKLFVKLGPMTHELPLVALAAAGAGADALVIGNTIPAMAIDVVTRRPKLANITGGLSGPGLHPVALKLVYDVARRVAREHPVPIIGLGGVSHWEDAAEFILAGAAAVGIGTALFADPRTPLRVIAGLERWTRAQNEPSINALVGALRV
ncbi:MAG: dihydroorotate dehydrogenase [Phycisphaerales bacterium]